MGEIQNPVLDHTMGGLTMDAFVPPEPPIEKYTPRELARMETRREPRKRHDRGNPGRDKQSFIYGSGVLEKEKDDARLATEQIKETRRLNPSHGDHDVQGKDEKREEKHVNWKPHRFEGHPPEFDSPNSRTHHPLSEGEKKWERRVMYFGSRRFR